MIEPRKREKMVIVGLSSFDTSIKRLQGRSYVEGWGGQNFEVFLKKKKNIYIYIIILMFSEFSL